MTQPNTQQVSQAVRGLVMGLAGFTLLSVGDGLVKSTAGQWPGMAVAALRYCFGTLGLGVFVVVRRGPAGFRVTRPGLQAMRGLAVAIATLGFFSGAQLMPLADATAIQFTSPIFAALFSWALLGERAPRAVWLTMAMAMVGVAIVLRPNVAVLGPAALLPVMAAIGMGLLVVLNRKAAGTAETLSLQFWLALAATPLLLTAAAAGHWSGAPSLHVPVPSWTVVLICAAVAVTGTLAHWLIFVATRHASAPVVAPTVYVQLVVATMVGWIAFGNTVDLAGAAGMALIIGSSLLLWSSQRHTTRFSMRRALTGRILR